MNDATPPSRRLPQATGSAGENRKGSAVSCLTAKRLNIVAQGQRRSRATLGSGVLNKRTLKGFHNELRLCNPFRVGFHLWRSPRVALHGCAVGLPWATLSDPVGVKSSHSGPF